MSTAKKKLIQFSEEDLNLELDDPRYEDGMKCVRTYWAQATRLDAFQQEEMVEYMRNHDYVINPSADRNPTAHKLYRATMRRYDSTLSTGGLSWPVYLILASVYEKLPKAYIQLIEEHFGSGYLKNHTQEYLEVISDTKRKLTTATKTSCKPRKRQNLTNKPAAATNIETTLTADDGDDNSVVEEEVIVYNSVRQAKRSVALEEVKRPRTFSDNQAIEPKRTRRTANIDDFDINHIVNGVKSSLTIQRFANATKSNSTVTEKPEMASSDLIEMKEDAKIAKETLERNEAKIDAVSTKLDKFISEMRQFMTAFANTAGIPLPIEVIEDDDDVESSI